MPINNQPIISVIVPAFKATNTIYPCLKSLLNQKTNILYEVIIVNYLTHLENEWLNNNLLIVKTVTLDKPLPPGLMRNSGASIAKGDYLLFIDVDIVVDKKLIQNTAHAIKEGHKVFSGAIEISFLSKKGIWKYIDHFFSFHEFQTRMPASKRNNLISTILVVKKSIFLEKGMFGPLPRMEDTEFSERLKKDGIDLYFDPAINGWHIYARKGRNVLKKAYINGINSFFLYYNHFLNNSFKSAVFFLLPPFMAFAKTLRIIYRNIKYRFRLEKMMSVLLTPFLILCGLYWMLGLYYGALFLKGKACEKGLSE